MTFDVDAYFERIAVSGAREPTVASLHAIVGGHGRSIPFENLDPLLGVPVDDLSPAVLADKLVARKRGGFCYEHNGLLGYVLADLGYGVERLAGRVVWMSEPDAPLPAMTHQVLSVTVPGDDAPYLVDVGFGGQTLTSPIRLEVGVEQQTRHEPYRLAARGDDLLLEARVRGDWQPLYVFGTRPQPRIDLEVGSWYVSTHPRAGFVTGLSAALVTDDARYNLRGRNLSIHRADGSEKVRFDCAADVLDCLEDRFRIDIGDLGERDVVEARVAQVLDV